jgi:transcriptional regulator with XRE-family HTH domain
MNNRIEKALSIRDMSRTELCEKTNIDKSKLSSWIKHRYEPKSESLYAMARVLNVAPAWLAGHDVPMETNNNLNIKASNIADIALALRNDNELIEIINNMQRDPNLKSLIYEASKLNESQIALLKNVILNFN